MHGKFHDVQCTVYFCTDKHFSCTSQGFVRVLENLESFGILLEVLEKGFWLPKIF